MKSSRTLKVRGPLAALLLLVAVPLSAQLRPSLTDSLIRHSLETFDLPEWQGTFDPLRPRIGLYLTELPPDTIRTLSSGAATTRGFRVWHVTPHWPADDAGMLMGDILLTMNGKPIGDSLYGGEEYVGITARDMNPGDTARFTLIRDGKVREMNVVVTPATRITIPFTAPPQLGPVVTNSWLQRMIAEKGLVEWTGAIQKQIRSITDQDFCTVPFAGRPNPWRLNAITYLQHYPTRLGAYSRLIVQDLWNGYDEPAGCGGVASAAARYLDIPSHDAMPPATVKDVRGLSDLISDVQGELDGAYQPVRGDLEKMIPELLKVLSESGSMEDEVDTTTNPVRKREVRLALEKRMATLFGNADKVNFSQLDEAARDILTLADTTWLRTFARGIATGGKFKRPEGVEGDILAAWTTPQGTFVIGGPGINRYTGTFRFILDVGGSDVYELPAVPVGTFRFVADLAGDDIYRSSEGGEGSGVGCVDVLVDLEGNDIYRTLRYGQGAGLLGVGVLEDLAGDDIYTGGWCSQGAGFLGIGALIDASGNDSYTADIYSQGFGYAKGFGALLDRSGNDSYRAGWKIADGLARIAHKSYIAMSQGFGFGMRPWTTGIGTDGGIGVLSDLDGDDVYTSDFFSQGGSYWYALGILHDERGSDRYTAGLYSQGNGIHLGFGALIDNAGDDSYDGYAGLSQGAAHDWSAGCLEDHEGNDVYRAAGSSQGSALNVSFSWLLDSGGDDSYYVKLSDTTLAQGGGNFNRPRKSGALGLLLDLGRGDDQYVEQRVTPGAPFVKGNGIIYDEGVPVK